MLSKLNRAWRRLCGRLGLVAGRWERFDVQVNVSRWTGWRWPGREREWPCSVYVPPDVADTDAAPLVLLLHGCRQRAEAFACAAGWVRAADAQGFRLLCPQQVRRANPFCCWSWFLPAAQRGGGELDVMRAALAEAERRWPTEGVTAVGLSAGGAMAALLAFHAADAVDAVVCVAAPPLLGMANTQDPRDVMKRGLRANPAVAVLAMRQMAPLAILHGEADDVVSVRCAEQLAEQALIVMARAHGTLHETPVSHGNDWLTASGQPVLRVQRLAGLAHVWSGAPGGHDFVQEAGPDLTAMALAWLTRPWQHRGSTPPEPTS